MKNTKIIFNVNNVNTELITTEDNVVIFNNSGEYHYYKGKYHRDNDEPAIITKYCEEWYQNGIRHRLNNPAAIRTSYDIGINIENKIQIPFPNYFNQLNRIEPDMENFKQIEYWENGKLHRINEPAIIIEFEYEKIYYRFEYMFQNGILYGGDSVKSVRGFKNHELVFFKTTDNKGKPHSFENEPALYDNIKNNEEYSYYNHGKLHRYIHPAYQSKKYSFWRIDNNFWREGDKPTEIHYTDKNITKKVYHKNGTNLIHRTNGPAIIEFKEGGELYPKKCIYFINGIKISKIKFLLLKFFKKI